MATQAGDVEYHIRAKLQKLRQDYEEADRLDMQYRRKWEQPIRLGGMAAGGGGGVLGNAGAAVASSPNVVGTSNGDVTWRLQDAMNRHEDKQQSAMSVARSLMRSPRMGGIGDGDSGIPGVSRDDMKDFRSMKREADAAVREQSDRLDYRARLMTGNYEAEQRRQKEEAAKVADRNGARSLLDARTGAAAGTSGEMPWGASSRINPYSGGPLGITEEVVEPAKPAGNWLTRKLGHTAIRSFAAAMVVDAVAGELNNTENYKKAVRLAGFGAQGTLAVGRAGIARDQGVFDSIPIVGGMIKNVANVGAGMLGGHTFQDQETQMDLAEQYGRYQGNMSEAMMMGRGMRVATSAYAMGQTGRALSAAGEAAMNRRLGILGLQDEMRRNAGFEKPAEDYGDLSPDETSFVSRGSSLVSVAMRYVDVARANRARLARNAERGGSINRTIDGLVKDSDAQADAQKEDIRRDARYQNTMSMVDIRRQQDENNFRPVGGQSRAIMQGTIYAAGYLVHGDADTATAEDKERAGLTVQTGIEQLKGMRRGIQEQFLYGKGQQIDPYLSSPLEFQDRNPESTSEQLDGIEKALSELVRLATAFAAGGSKPGTGG